MVRRSDHEKISQMLKDTIMLLCKNGLSFKNKFTIEAVIGVTVDENDIFLLSMNEIVNSVQQDSSSEAYSSEEEVETSSARRPCKRQRSPLGESPQSEAISDCDTKVTPRKLYIVDSSNVENPFSAVVEDEEDDDDEDIVFIKEEQEHIIRPEMNYPDFTAMASAYQSPEVNMTPPRTAPMWQSMGTPIFPCPSGHIPTNLGNLPSITNSHTIMPTNPIIVTPTIEELTPHKTPKQSTPKTPLQCLMCNKTFTERSYFRRHLDAHRGVYPFHCPICQKGVLTKQHLRYHMDRLHQGVDFQDATNASLQHVIVPGSVNSLAGRLSVNSVANRRPAAGPISHVHVSVNSTTIPGIENHVAEPPEAANSVAKPTAVKSEPKAENSEPASANSTNYAGSMNSVPGPASD